MKVNLDDMTRQNDGVWSTVAAEELKDFSYSNLYSKFKTINDYSELSKELNNSDTNFSERLHLSPMRANVFRAFEWKGSQDILEIGCSSGALTYYFAQSGINIDAIEPNRQLAQLAQLRTTSISGVKIFSEPFYRINFGEKKYDRIILNGGMDYARYLAGGAADVFLDSVRTLLKQCKGLLGKDGQIFLIADNRQGLKYIYGASDERLCEPYRGFIGYKAHDANQTLNLSEWRELIKEIDFDRFDEYYLFPDYRFTRVILGQQYCQSNPYAFQHLEGIRSKDYVKYQNFGVDELLLYQAANAHGHLGDFANSCLFILSNSESQSQSLDFAHLPDFQRRSEFITLITKPVNQNLIERTKLFDKSASEDNQIEIEQYQPGLQLSVIWRNSILVDHKGIEFQQYLIEYFEFLKKQDAGVLTGMNLDAIANNIIVDEQNNYHIIDTEWQSHHQQVNAPYVFYRAIVNFGLRNESIMFHFNWKNSITTLGDFVNYCFDSIGLEPSMHDLDTMRSKDMEFLGEVQYSSVNYEFSNLFGNCSISNPLYPTINWRFENESYLDHQQSSSVVNNYVKENHISFLISDLKRPIDAIRFFPFDGIRDQITGYFCIKSMYISIVDEIGIEREIIKLDSSKQVAKANIHEGVYYGEKDNEAIFMFSNNNTFLEFNLPKFEINSNESLKINMSFRLNPSVDYEIARKNFSLVNRKIIEQEKKFLEHIDQLKYQNKQLQKQLQDVKASRIWRLLEAYRDTFKISGYPEKNFFGKVSHLVKRFRG